MKKHNTCGDDVLAAGEDNEERIPHTFFGNYLRQEGGIGGDPPINHSIKLRNRERWREVERGDVTGEAEGLSWGGRSVLCQAGHNLGTAGVTGRARILRAGLLGIAFFYSSYRMKKKDRMR